LKPLFDRLSNKILGSGMGERTQTFAHGLSWVGSAAVLSRLLSGTATMLVARWIGPGHFGEASVALAASFWIQIPLFAGLPTALMHYIPQKNISERGTWSATGLEVSSFFAIATLVVCYLGRGFFSHNLGISEALFNLALVWSGAYALYTACTSILSGQEQFKDRARFELLFAILYPALIFCLKLTKRLDAKAYIYALAIGYGIVGMTALLTRISFSWKGGGFWIRTRNLLGYGLISSGGSVVTAMLLSPSRLIANRYLSGADVGILSAYYAGSIQMGFSLVSAGSQVFFPIASRTPNKYALLKKVRRLLIPALLLLTLIFATTLFGYFILLGKHYPLNLNTVFVFAIAAALTTVHNFLLWFLAAIGKRGNGISSLIGLTAGTVNVLGCLWFIPKEGMLGAGFASSLGSLLGITLCFMPFVLRCCGLEATRWA
jgi:O-antigen/teichoic acid export membrane protein